MHWSSTSFVTEEAPHLKEYLSLIGNPSPFTAVEPIGPDDALLVVDMQNDLLLRDAVTNPDGARFLNGASTTQQGRWLGLLIFHSGYRLFVLVRGGGRLLRGARPQNFSWRAPWAFTPRSGGPRYFRRGERLPS